MRKVERFENTLLKFIEITTEPEQQVKKIRPRLPSLQLSRVTVGLSDTEAVPYVYQQFKHTPSPLPSFRLHNNNDQAKKVKSKMLIRQYNTHRKYGNSFF